MSSEPKNVEQRTENHRRCPIPQTLPQLLDLWQGRGLYWGRLCQLLQDWETSTNEHPQPETSGMDLHSRGVFDGQRISYRSSGIFLACEEEEMEMLVDVGGPVPHLNAGWNKKKNACTFWNLTRLTRTICRQGVWNRTGPLLQNQLTPKTIWPTGWGHLHSLLSGVNLLSCLESEGQEVRGDWLYHTDAAAG